MLVIKILLSARFRSVPTGIIFVFLACAVVGLPVHNSAAHQGSVQHSHPMLGGRRGQGRRLPPTPCKPSTLQLRPGPINFPKLNASPTHVSFIFI